MLRGRRGTQDVFDERDIVALQGKHRHNLPHHLRDQKFFLLVKLSVPDNVFYVSRRSERRWARIQACNEDGVLVPDSKPLNVKVTWLDPEFAVSVDDDKETRQEAGMADFEPDVLQHRIEVCGCCLSPWFMLVF